MITLINLKIQAGAFLLSFQPLNICVCTYNKSVVVFYHLKHTHTHNLFLPQILRCPQHPIVSPLRYATPMVPRSIILFCLSKSAAQLRVWRVCGVFCPALLRQKITISPRNKLLQESKVVSSSPTRGRITYIHCLCRT